MSAASDQATVFLTMADFANTDVGGKLNVVGGHVTTLGYDSEMALTAPFTLVAEVVGTRELVHQEFAFELTLTDRDGKTVELPGPAGSQQMRIGQAMSFTAPSPDPKGWLDPRETVVFNFANGLPLTVNSAYAWFARIDGVDDGRHCLRFTTPSVQEMPVMG